MLVTHDRYLLDRVSNIVLGLNGQGGAESFGDYAQWELWRAERKPDAKPTDRSTTTTIVPGSSGLLSKGKKKLSYLEAREYSGMEQRIADAERLLHEKRVELENPAIASDGPRLVAANAEVGAVQKDLDSLYARWAELEESVDNSPRSDSATLPSRT